MGKFQIEATHRNAGLFGLVVLIYVALLLLFAWQTLLFVNILFPDADLTMKILTVFSVDGMGFVWACLHTFYRFAHPHAKSAVKWGWGVTYGLSALLSILYLVFTFILNFQHVTDDTYIKIGVGLSIGALMFNLGAISVFLFWEISTRFPNEDEFVIVDKPTQSQQQPVHPPVQQPPSTPVQDTAQRNNPLYDSYFTSGACQDMSYADYVERVTGSRTPATAQQRQAQFQQQPQHPLAQPPLDTTASQPGTNGNTNGHQSNKSQA